MLQIHVSVCETVQFLQDEAEDFKYFSSFIVC